MGIAVAGGGSDGSMNVSNDIVVNLPVAIGDKEYRGADILKGLNIAPSAAASLTDAATPLKVKNVMAGSGPMNYKPHTNIFALLI